MVMKRCCEMTDYFAITAFGGLFHSILEQFWSSIDQNDACYQLWLDGQSN